MNDKKRKENGNILRTVVRCSSWPRETKAGKTWLFPTCQRERYAYTPQMDMSITVRSPCPTLLSSVPCLATLRWGCVCWVAVSERIMQFVQCSADVGELERVRQCRDRRASLRAEGLRLIRTLVTAAASPPAKVTGQSYLFASALFVVVCLWMFCHTSIVFLKRESSELSVFSFI